MAIYRFTSSELEGFKNALSTPSVKRLLRESENINAGRTKDTFSCLASAMVFLSSLPEEYSGWANVEMGTRGNYIIERLKDYLVEASKNQKGYALKNLETIVSALDVERYLVNHLQKMANSETLPKNIKAQASKIGAELIDKFSDDYRNLCYIVNSETEKNIPEVFSVTRKDKKGAERIVKVDAISYSLSGADKVDIFKAVNAQFNTIAGKSLKSVHRFANIKNPYATDAWDARQQVDSLNIRRYIDRIEKFMAEAKLSDEEKASLAGFEDFLTFNENEMANGELLCIKNFKAFQKTPSGKMDASKSEAKREFLSEEDYINYINSDEFRTFVTEQLGQVKSPIALYSDPKHYVSIMKKLKSIDVDKHNVSVELGNGLATSTKEIIPRSNDAEEGATPSKKGSRRGCLVSGGVALLALVVLVGTVASVKSCQGEKEEETTGYIDIEVKDPENTDKEVIINPADDQEKPETEAGTDESETEHDYSEPATERDTEVDNVINPDNDFWPTGEKEEPITTPETEESTEKEFETSNGELKENPADKSEQTETEAEVSTEAESETEPTPSKRPGRDQSVDGVSEDVNIR